jgi:hypothetical protein
MRHELKIWPQYYCRVADGSKTFEVRKNDRGFQQGDEVVLSEYAPIEHSVIAGRYTDSKPLEFRVGYVLPIDDERVVFSLLPPTPAAKSADGED